VIPSRASRGFWAWQGGLEEDAEKAFKDNEGEVERDGW
jgi:hypothetical protein